MTAVETPARSARRSSLVSNWAHALRTCGPPERVDPISKWLVITRACVQPMTLSAVAVGGLLAARSPLFDGGLFALAAIGVIVAHAANNMINDIFDVSSGLDTASYPRALYAPHPVLEGLISRKGLASAAVAANAVDAAIMVILFAARGWPVLAFALAGLFISVGYVAPPLRLKAHGLGEPGVFLVWGPLMIGGLYYSAAGTIPAEVWWASVAYGLLIASVLMGKHIDKAPWDEAESVRTLPVILGDRAARIATVGMMIGFYVGIATLVAAGALSPWSLVVALAVPRLVATVRRFSRPKPERPPDGYPVWPLWYASWAFVHSRRAGALWIVGLAAGNLFG